MAEYCACCANRPNKIIAADRPISTPTGARNAIRLVNTPTSTNTTMMPSATAAVIGSARLFCWLTSLATIRICFSRPALARSSELLLSTTGSAFPHNVSQHQAAYGFRRTGL
jgi:hypothetical protein